MGAITPFGKLSRKLRKAKGLLLGDVSDAYGVSPSYVSQLETGKRRIPDGFVDKVSKFMKLTPGETRKLRAAANISRSEFSLPIQKDAEDIDYELAHQLSIGFARLNTQQKRKILKMLGDG